MIYNAGIVIVPTAATGASGLVRDVPRPIIFCLPNRKAASEVDYFVQDRGRDTGAGSETYLEAFEQVFNDMLKPFGKRVAKPFCLESGAGGPHFGPEKSRNRKYANESHSFAAFSYSTGQRGQTYHTIALVHLRANLSL
jgi:hypothetical protein